MERAAVAIEEKIGTMYGRRFIGFIDCNCLETDRPGGRPSEAGANSSRWDSDIQRTFYNGWKSIHGLIFQTVNKFASIIKRWMSESHRLEFAPASDGPPPGLSVSKQLQSMKPI